MSGRGAELVLDIVEWMARQHEAVGLAELVKALAVPKSSALLALRLLVARGYVERTKTGDYRILSLPGELNAGNQAWDTLVRVVVPWIEDGVQQISETGCLAILTNRMQIKYISKTLPQREIVYDRDVSVLRAPQDVTSGIVLLGALAEDRLADHLLGVLDAAEKHEAVLQKVAKARSDGYFVNLQGVVEGAAGVAAPVFDGSGHMVAAVNYCGPKERFASNIDRAIAQVVTTARLASEDLGRRFRRKESKGRMSNDDTD